MSDRVLVGLSGGVDSALSAWLLQQQGYTVSGVFMRNWDDDGGKYCTAQQDFLDACRVAEHLGIELITANFTKEYKTQVFARCLELYKRGLTPNPDVWCNSHIKFGALLDYAQGRADRLATGHYARLLHDGNQVRLLRGVDTNKDQSYFLHQLTRQQLAKCLFPLGDKRKPWVREQAQRIGLPNYDRPGSTGICFIGERPFTEFLRQYLPATPGDILDQQGRVVGQHQGLAFYTIGQRKGLGIGGSRHASGEAWYVYAKDLAANRLLVTQGSDHPLLYARSLEVDKLHWICPDREASYLEQKISSYRDGTVARPTLSATIRYRQSLRPCTLQRKGTGEKPPTRIMFAESQKAITAGQFAVLYAGGECLGGGVILRVLP